MTNDYALPAYFCCTWCLEHFSEMIDVEAFLNNDEEMPQGMRSIQGMQDMVDNGDSGVQ